MAFDFPSSPILNQEFTAGDTVYLWNGYGWEAKGASASELVLKAGDTMTGPLVLPGDPSASLQAAPKQYVDSAVRTYAAPLDALAYSGMQLNGGFDVSQERGQGTNTTVVGAYFADAWQQYYGGTMVINTASYLASLVPGMRSCSATNVNTAQASLGANDNAVIVHRIEGYRTSRLSWGLSAAVPITLAFWVQHTLAGTYSGTIRNNANTRCYAFTYTQNVANVAEYKTIVIPGDTTGAWLTDNGVGLILTFTIAAGSTLTAPSANTWLVGNYYAAPGQVNGVATTAPTFRFTGVVVIPGTQAPTAAQSPLIMRPYDQELLLCQRYWQCTNSAVPLGGPEGLLSGNSLIYPGIIFGSWKLDTSMRAAPTLKIFCNGVQNQVRNDSAGGYVAVTGLGTSTPSRERLRSVSFTGSPLTTQTQYSFDMQFDARL